MSSRTLDSRLARLRASDRFDLRRARSLLWAASFSRSRDRLFCFRAEEVRVASESRRRLSWVMTFSRLGWECQSDDAARCMNVLLTFPRRSSSLASVVLSSSVGFCGMFGAEENCE